MLRLIVICGAVAGLVVTAPMFVSLLTGRLITDSLLVGYLVMILALSLVFVAVKHHRDRTLGGVIRFWPALMIGLGVSAVASVFYVVGWEITLAATRFAFIDAYGAAMVEAVRARGGSAAQLARAAAEADAFRVRTPTRSTACR
jgi:hypothetical protein